MANILFVKTTKSFSTDKALSPPMGILYLIAYLRRARPGDVCRALDLRLVRDGPRALADACEGFTPDIVAFSAMTIEAESLHASAAWCRARFPRAVLIAGGPHVSSFGADVLADPHMDYILAGEGERPFVKFVAALEAGNRAPVISGLSYRGADGALVTYPPNEDLAPMEELPLPAWDLIDFDRYRDARMAPISYGRYAALFTSRGCPYRCTYCHHIFPKRYRAMPPAQVVDEIEALGRAYGIREFEIYDDTFNLRRERVIGICDEILRRGLKVRLLFPNGVRGDLLDEPVIRKLRQAGTVFLAVAVESASPRIQKEIRKHNDLAKIRRAITAAAREGMFTWGAFMMGFPGETRRELWRTARYAVTSDLHGAHFFIVIPQAGTELARRAGLDVRSYAQIKATDYWTTKNTLSAVSHWELWLWQTLAFVAFYGYPLRWVRALRAFPYPARVFFHKAFRRGVVFVWLTFVRNLLYRVRGGRRHSAARQATA